MKKISAMVLIFLTGFASCLILTHGTLRAQGTNESDVMAKLDTIASGQQEIVSTLNGMKEDLKVIKIRLTQLQ